MQSIDFKKSEFRPPYCIPVFDIGKSWFLVWLTPYLVTHGASRLEFRMQISSELWMTVSIAYPPPPIKPCYWNLVHGFAGSLDVPSKISTIHWKIIFFHYKFRHRNNFILAWFSTRHCQQKPDCYGLSTDKICFRVVKDHWDSFWPEIICSA